MKTNIGTAKRFAVVVVVLLAAACGGNGFSSGAVLCLKNQTQECVCAGGVVGAQTCMGDGSEWSACACAAGDSSNTTIATDAGVPRSVAMEGGVCLGACRGNTWGGCPKANCEGNCVAIVGEKDCSTGLCEGLCTVPTVGRCYGTCESL